MPVVPINRAEAIIEPFWDPEISELRRYRFEADEGTGGMVRQNWCWISFQWDRCAASKCPGRITRHLDLDVSTYDRFIVQAGVPRFAGFTLTAVIDGQRQTVVRAEHGNDDFFEYEGAFTGKRLSELSLEIHNEVDGPAAVHVNWIGLADSSARSLITHRKSGYTADWPTPLARSLEGGSARDKAGAKRSFDDLFYLRKRESLEATDPKPALGLLFDAAELRSLRQKLHYKPFAGMMESLRESARRHLDDVPEELVYEYAATGNARYARERDKNRAVFANVPSLLAFVGLVDRDANLLHMAARYVMAVVHTDYWFESMMGRFPYSRWHHRSFYEELYSTAVVLALDWAGAAFTNSGFHAALDALEEKALIQMERDFREMHYIRHCNQGLVFNRGRILVALALLWRETREPTVSGPCPGQFVRQSDYHELIDRAERDQFEMVHNYVLPDGGTLEGAGYWNYTFSTALMGFAALVRHRGRSVRRYVPEDVRRTGRYGLVMLSESGPPGTYIAVNDCHTGRYAASIAAFYGGLLGDSRWQEVFLASESQPDILALVWGSPRQPAARRKTFLFECLPQSGQVAVRSADRTRFHLVSGGCGNGSHTHEDKGSFIVECNGEPAIIDRGVLAYSHPACGLLGRAERHNLLTPVPDAGERIYQLRNGEGGRIVCAESAGQSFIVCTDTTAAWPHHFRKCLRAVFSPRPGLWLVVDTVELVQPRGLAFHLHTRFAVERANGALRLKGERSGVLVQPPRPADAGASWFEDSLDEHGHPVTHVKLQYPRCRRAQSVVLVEASAGEAPLVWTPVPSGLERKEERLVFKTLRDGLSISYERGTHKVGAVVRRTGECTLLLPNVR